MQQLVNHLNRQLSNVNVLYVKLQNYHWYVKGENFFDLHSKFQELYEQLPEAIDEIAERILTIGGNPTGTLKSFVETASLEEARGGEDAAEMVAVLEEDYRKLAGEMIEGVKLAESSNDVVTADLYTGLAASFEKTVWMLNSYLARATQHV